MPCQALPISVIAVHSLTPTMASHPDELIFHSEDVINVTGLDFEFWWEGRVNGKSGVFPVTYVEPLLAFDVVALYPHYSPDPEDLNFEIDDIIEVKRRINLHWWRGTLNDRVGLVPMNFVAPVVGIYA